MTPTPPEGSPRPGERYRRWDGVLVRVVSLFLDTEVDCWYVVYCYKAYGVWEHPISIELYLWMEPVRVAGGGTVPRFVREE